jgi:hypothetical protein
MHQLYAALALIQSVEQQGPKARREQEDKFYREMARESRVPRALTRATRLAAGFFTLAASGILRLKSAAQKDEQGGHGAGCDRKQLEHADGIAAGGLADGDGTSRFSGCVHGGVS